MPEPYNYLVNPMTQYRPVDFSPIAGMRLNNERLRAIAEEREIARQNLAKQEAAKNEYVKLVSEGRLDPRSVMEFEARNPGYSKPFVDMIASYDSKTKDNLQESLVPSLMYIESGNLDKARAELKEKAALFKGNDQFSAIGDVLESAATNPDLTINQIKAPLVVAMSKLNPDKMKILLDNIDKNQGTIKGAQEIEAFPENQKIKRSELVIRLKEANTARINAEVQRDKAKTDEEKLAFEKEAQAQKDEIERLKLDMRKFETEQLSPGEEKRTAELRDTATKSRVTIAKANDALEKINTISRSTGWKGSFFETIKSATGSGDEATLLMKDLGNMSAQAISAQRAPGEGPQSDADAKRISAGMPKITDSNEVWKPWLESLSRYAAYNQAASEIEEEWMTNIHKQPSKRLKNVTDEDGLPKTVKGFAVLPGENLPLFMKRLGKKIYSDLNTVPKAEIVNQVDELFK